MPYLFTSIPYSSAASRRLTFSFTISKNTHDTSISAQKRRPARSGTSRRLCLFLCCFDFFLVLGFSQGFLPCALQLDLRCIPASIGAVFDAASRRKKHLAAVFTGTLSAAVFCCLLPVEFRPAVGAAEQGGCPLGCKFLPAALAGQCERLTDSVFPCLDFFDTVRGF